MITVYNYKSTDVGKLMVKPNTFVLIIMQSKGAILGNPFYNRKDLTRAQKIEKFRVWFIQQFRTNQRVQEVVYQLRQMHIQGIDIALMCCCKPHACHGDVIKMYIESAVGGIL